MTDNRAINFRKQYGPPDYRDQELTIAKQLCNDPVMEQLFTFESNIQDCYVYAQSATGLTREEIKRQAFISLYNNDDIWSFNPYRKVDEIANEDSDDVPYFDPDYDWEDYTDADAQLDNDYRDYIDDEVE